jgi:hypothetical protein
MRTYNFTVNGITYRIEAENFTEAISRLRQLVSQ